MVQNGYGLLLVGDVLVSYHLLRQLLDGDGLLLGGLRVGLLDWVEVSEVVPLHTLADGVSSH